MTHVQQTPAAAVRGYFAQTVSGIFPEQPEVSTDLQGEGKSTFLWTGAIRIAKALETNPFEIAQQIDATFPADVEAEIREIKPSGALIVAIKIDSLPERLAYMQRDEHLGVQIPPRQRVIVDLSAPNIAKQLHVGHLRSTIIGDCIARVQEFLQHSVLRLNHVGDWGTPFGMLIHYLKKHNIDVLSLDLTQLMNYYRASRKEFDADEEFKTSSREAVARLQGGDEEAYTYWQQICQVSRTSFDEIYRLLDVQLEERGESFYNPFLEPLVGDLLERGIAQESEGAICVFTEGHKVPFFLRKSDGGYTYDTTDLAALKHRIEIEGAERLLYVVDAGQSDHFEQVKEVAMRAGILDESKVSFEHIPFGVVTGADGKRLKTRSGETALLRDLVDLAISTAAKELSKRNINDPESARTLGIGALKYADFKNSREKNYEFNAERMLSSKGDTAAYILYALVRLRSIQKNVGVEAKSSESWSLEAPEEQELASLLIQFGDVIARVDKTSEPHHLCKYLHTVASQFNSFYKECPVNGHPDRLNLCGLTEKVLSKGMFLLGIGTLERM